MDKNVEGKRKWEGKQKDSWKGKKGRDVGLNWRGKEDKLAREKSAGKGEGKVRNKVGSEMG